MAHRGRAEGRTDRDRLWDHPDLLPDSDALEDPVAFADGASGSDWDISTLHDADPSEEPPGEGPAPGMTLTDSARELLTGWTPHSASQVRLRDEFVDHLDANDDGWSRTCLPDHLTASMIVLDHTRTHVMLALHRKVGLWLQFGGHIEPGDRSVLDAAHRETREESGLADMVLPSGDPVQLDRHAAPCGAAARHHLDVQFLALTDRSASPAPSAGVARS